MERGGCFQGRSSPSLPGVKACVRKDGSSPPVFLLFFSVQMKDHLLFFCSAFSPSASFMLLWNKTRKELQCHSQLRKQHPPALKPGASLSLAWHRWVVHDGWVLTHFSQSPARAAQRVSPVLHLQLPRSHAARFSPKFCDGGIGLLTAAVCYSHQGGEEVKGCNFSTCWNGRGKRELYVAGKGALQKSLDSTFMRKAKEWENTISLDSRSLKWKAKALSAGPRHEQHLSPKS